MHVDDTDLKTMSAISFNDFNSCCSIIDTQDAPQENTYNQFQDCINHIKEDFQYPQYYNGLIALLLLFHSDASYWLRNRDRVKQIFQDTKELATIGYEKFENFGYDNIDRLISNLNIMSDIFTNQHMDRMNSRSPYIRHKERYEDNFVHPHGIKTQTSPIDFSSASLLEPSNNKTLDLYRHLPMKYKLDSDKRIKYLFENFERAYRSATSGFLLTTIIGKYIRSNLTENAYIIFYHTKIHLSGKRDKTFHMFFRSCGR